MPANPIDVERLRGWEERRQQWNKLSSDGAWKFWQDSARIADAMPTVLDHVEAQAARIAELEAAAREALHHVARNPLRSSLHEAAELLREVLDGR